MNAKPLSLFALVEKSPRNALRFSINVSAMPHVESRKFSSMHCAAHASRIMLELDASFYF